MFLMTLTGDLKPISLGIRSGEKYFENSCSLLGNEVAVIKDHPFLKSVILSPDWSLESSGGD